jgi:hypothetical protein
MCHITMWLGYTHQLHDRRTTAKAYPYTARLHCRRLMLYASLNTYNTGEQYPGCPTP